MIDTKNLKPHPAAECFPMMDEKRLAELQDDIRKYGQMEPITVCDGMILDGRNRYAACVALGITPTARLHRGDPWLFAWSLNGARRDLKQTVRALIYLKCVEGSKRWNDEIDRMEAEANRKRAAAAKVQPRGIDGKLREKPVVDHRDPPPAKPPKQHVARETMAAELDVSTAVVGRAQEISKKPDLRERVIAGEIKPAAALREVRGDAPPRKSSCVAAFKKLWANANDADRLAIRAFVNREIGVALTTEVTNHG